MTDREKAIVMAYTGVCMLTGDKFKIFHGYVEDIMGRPIWTHELGIGSIADEIKEKSKADFMALCADESSSEKPNKCDLISREWLKTAIHNFYYGLKHTPTEEDIQAYIDAAPSVSTEKTGRWIAQDIHNCHTNFKCSECGYIHNFMHLYGKPTADYTYCPNCGSQMMEVE